MIREEGYLPFGLLESVVLALEGLHTLLQGLNTLQHVHVLLHYLLELGLLLLVPVLHRTHIVGLECLGAYWVLAATRFLRDLYRCLRTGVSWHVLVEKVLRVARDVDRTSKGGALL